MKQQMIILLIAIFLASCTPVSVSVPVSTATDIPKPTATFTPGLTATPIMSTVEGVLFFDMNANGLRDNASFLLTMDNDGRPPLIIQSLFPEITGKSGDVVSVDEPSLDGFKVCVNVSDNEYCGETDTIGKYTISNIPVASGAKVTLKITDPNADNVPLAMKYINVWLKAVVIPSYEQNGISVPEQNLNDTKTTEISSPITVTTEKPLEIGLVQGWLTLPYLLQDSDKYWLSNFVDLDVKSGQVINFLGSTDSFTGFGSKKTNWPTGTFDQHYGLDFDGAQNLFVTSSATGTVFYIGTHNNHVQIMHRDNISSGSGHFNNVVVKMDAKILRGQIIALNGNFDTNHSHIHFGIYRENKVINNRPVALDPFGSSGLLSGCEVYKTGIVDNQAICSGPNFWTVYQTMVFSK